MFKSFKNHLLFPVVGGVALGFAPWWATVLFGIGWLILFPFFAVRKVVQVCKKMKQPAMNEPINRLLALNEDGLHAFVEGNTEHYRNVDKATQNLLEKFRQDFIDPIAELTPEGKFERFKANVTDDQIVFVTSHVRKFLEKFNALRTSNDEAAQGLANSIHSANEHGKLYKEVDAIFDNPDLLDSDKLSECFQSELGKKFFAEYTKRNNSKSAKRWAETSSDEDFQAYVEENHSDLIEIYKKYGLGPVGYLGQPDDTE